MKDDLSQQYVRTSPMAYQRTMRRDDIMLATTGRAGKTIPLGFIPMFREDAVQTARLRCEINMRETAELLMNGVAVEVRATYVPPLALERFNGLDEFNASYGKYERREGEGIIPFFETVTYDRNADFWNTTGIQWPQSTPINAAYLQAYNVAWNARARAKSANLTLRDENDTSLAPAFWHHAHTRDIVPDFDDAMIDGDVALFMANQQLPVVTDQESHVVRFKDEATGDAIRMSSADSTLKYGPVESGAVENVFAEMQASNIPLTLASIDQARQTRAFAEIRQKYKGLRDDDIVDLLMSGLRVPSEEMREPITLASRTTILGYNRRFASDAANLEKSLTSGQSSVDLAIRTPPMMQGGVIVITAQVLPERIMERKEDAYLAATDPDDLPNAQRDSLDTRKVHMVRNKEIDVLHSDPEGIFGYVGMNKFRWDRANACVGGEFMRDPDPAVWQEERQRIWTNERIDPALDTDWYLATDLHEKVFADYTSDTFEFQLNGPVTLSGLTVFGKRLEEGDGNYEAVADAGVPNETQE